jgi:NAD dependent epimerase/dehydratase family enzyme
MPAFAARLALGEMADALILSSARVLPRKLESAGYQFLHPEISGALRDVLKRR